MIEYKDVEVTPVTDDALERALNEWTRQGWTYDGMQLAIREGSKRPSMAFVLFVREIDAPPQSSQSSTSL